MKPVGECAGPRRVGQRFVEEDRRAARLGARAVAEGRTARDDAERPRAREVRRLDAVDDSGRADGAAAARGEVFERSGERKPGRVRLYFFGAAGAAGVTAPPPLYAWMQRSVRSRSPRK